MQLALGFDPSIAGREVWQSELEWASRVVALARPKVVAPTLDIAPSTLSEALHERNDKGLKGEWISILRHMATPDMRAEYLAIIARPLGFEPPRPIETRTPEQKLADLERLMRLRLGDIGEQILKENGP